MSWDAIGAIAELLGALAVIATLVYLAKQIRQNTNAVLVQTYSAVSDRVSASNAGPQTEYLSGILERGRHSYRGLTPAEQLSFSYWMLERVMEYEAIVDSPEAVNPSIIEACNRNLRHLFGVPGVREWWQSEDREDISGRMTEHVEKWLRRRLASGCRTIGLLPRRLPPVPVTDGRIGSLGVLFTPALSIAPTPEQSASKWECDAQPTASFPAHERSGPLQVVAPRLQVPASAS